MSSTIGSQLTEEQKEFLASLEEEFKDRYTEKDAEFNALLKQTLPPPPIVTNWRDFRHRDDRRNRYRYERRRSRSRSPHNKHYRGNGDRYTHHSSRDGFRYSHSSRDDYNRYNKRNHDDSYEH